MVVTNNAFSTIDNTEGSYGAWLPCSFSTSFAGAIGMVGYMYIDLGYDCNGCNKTVLGIVTQGRGVGDA